MDIRKLFEETNMNMAEIAEYTGADYTVLIKESGLNGTEIAARETKINVHDVLGYDGSDPRNICVRCGIIMIHEGAGVPDRWGMHQRSVGNVCSDCSDKLWDEYQDEYGFLSTCSCLFCPEEPGLYYYKPLARYIHPSLAVPLCQAHKESAYEEGFARVVRHFHDGLPRDVVVALHWRV